MFHSDTEVKASESALNHPVWRFVHLLPAPAFQFKISLRFTACIKKPGGLGDSVISEVTSTPIPHPVLTRRACLRADLFAGAA